MELGIYRKRRTWNSGVGETWRRLADSSLAFERAQTCANSNCNAREEPGFYRRIKICVDEVRLSRIAVKVSPYLTRSLCQGPSELTLERLKMHAA